MDVAQQIQHKLEELGFTVSMRPVRVPAQLFSKLTEAGQELTITRRGRGAIVTVRDSQQPLDEGAFDGVIQAIEGGFNNAETTS